MSGALPTIPGANGGGFGGFLENAWGKFMALPPVGKAAVGLAVGGTGALGFYVYKKRQANASNSANNNNQNAQPVPVLSGVYPGNDSITSQLPSDVNPSPIPPNPIAPPPVSPVPPSGVPVGPVPQTMPNAKPRPLGIHPRGVNGGKNPVENHGSRQSTWSSLVH